MEENLAVPERVFLSRADRKRKHPHRHRGGVHLHGRQRQRVRTSEDGGRDDRAQRDGPNGELLLPSLTPKERELVSRLIAFLALGRSQSNGPEEPQFLGQVASTVDPEPLAMTASILVGPCESVSSMQPFIDDLATAPGLKVLFEAFHGGFYRVDGHALDMQMLADWAAGRPDVESVVVNGTALHVIPAGPPP